MERKRNLEPWTILALKKQRLPLCGLPLVSPAGGAGLLPTLRRYFFPLSLLRSAWKIWQSPPEFPVISFRVFLSAFDKNGRKKQETFFDFLFCAAVCGGGYLVVIPRKQTCSPCLKRSLCRWAFCCPALSFSAGCRSRWLRLTGSSRFPCSTRLQRFVPL